MSQPQRCVVYSERRLSTLISHGGLYLLAATQLTGFSAEPTNAQWR